MSTAENKSKKEKFTDDAMPTHFNRIDSYTPKVRTRRRGMGTERGTRKRSTRIRTAIAGGGGGSK